MKSATVKRAVTAHDVARLAKVSQAAVSRTFTKGASVSEQTRLKVLEAARQLGYRPNLAARSLITRRTGMIGVVVPGLENAFYGAALQCLSNELNRLGYRIVLFLSPLGKQSDPVLEEVLRAQVDALVLVSVSLSSELAEECRQMGVPVVLLNRRTQSSAASSITGDNLAGGRLIARFLMAGGHKRMAYVAGLDDSSTSTEREQGFTRALAEAGLAVPRRKAGSYSAQGAAAATRALLARDPPDAIFYANDYMALAGMGVAQREFGLAPGRDLSIVGFDDAAPAAWPVCGLTTFRQPIAEMAGRAAARVVTEIGEPGGVVHEIVPGELIVRDSARLPTEGRLEHSGTDRIWRPPA